MNIGGLFKSLINPATLMQLAMGPAGWASLVVKTLAVAIGKELIQQLGQQLGLPQGVIDLAKTALSAATGTAGGPQTIAEAAGQIAQQFGMSPAEQGDMQRTSEDALNTLLSNAAADPKFKAARSSGSGGKSWLMAIAEAMGKVIDAKANQMTQMAGQITDKTPSLTAKFSAASQEFGIMMNALTTVIKTAGESISATARKQ